MSRISERLDRWKPALTMVCSAFVLGAVGWVAEGRLTVPVVMAIAITLGWGWWVSPLRRAQPHVDHADAPAAAGREGLIAYWRPGCSYCVRLWRALRPDERDRITWVNIMADAQGPDTSCGSTAARWSRPRSSPAWAIGRSER